MSKLYEESGSFSPRVRKAFNLDDYSVNYTANQANQGKQCAVIKRYMLSDDKDQIKADRVASINSISKLESISLGKALAEPKENHVFLWDIIDRNINNKDIGSIHTLCVVKIGKILYLVDPSSSEYTAKFPTWSNEHGMNVQSLEHIAGNSKSQFYKSQGAEKRDCIDIAFKIAQRVSNDLQQIADGPGHEDKIRTVIKPLSNINKVNELLGGFNEGTFGSLQSSDLELSKNTLDLLTAYAEVDKAYKEQIGSVTKLKAIKDCERVLDGKKKKIEEAEKALSVAKAKFYSYEQNQEQKGNDDIEYDKDGWQNIHRTVYKGDINEFKKLLTENPDSISFLTTSGNNVLHMACLYGRTNFIDYIKSNYPEQFNGLLYKYNYEGLNPMHTAYYAGKSETIDYLLTKVDSKLSEVLTRDNQTVLHIAAGYGYYNLVRKTIIDHPEFLSKLDDEGYTPLHSAIYGGEELVVKYLMHNHYQEIRDNTQTTMEDLLELADDYHPELAGILQPPQAPLAGAEALSD